jgi:hypothetical protein
MISAMRLGNTSTDLLPYVMIRTAKGVTLEGIDGVDYLKQDKAETPDASSIT